MQTFVVCPPVAKNLPATQAVQVLISLAPVAALQVPATQSVHAEFPVVVVAVYFPAGQSVQTPKVVTANWYFPTGQGIVQASVAVAAAVTAVAVVLPSAQTVHEP